jgi:hypothetical protein
MATAPEARARAERTTPRYPIETKPFFLTSEFFAPLLLIIAMAISAATNDGFDARVFWSLTSGVVAAYLISRGIAKSGTKSRSYDPREEVDLFERRTDDAARPVAART